MKLQRPVPSGAGLFLLGGAISASEQPAQQPADAADQHAKLLPEGHGSPVRWVLHGLPLLCDKLTNQFLALWVGISGNVVWHRTMGCHAADHIGMPLPHS